MRCSAVSLSSGTLFDLDNKRKLRDKLTEQMGAPNFWDNQEKAQQVIQQLKPLHGIINPFEDLVKAGDDLNALCELCAEDDSLEADLQKELHAVEKKLDEFEASWHAYASKLRPDGTAGK